MNDFGLLAATGVGVIVDPTGMGGGSIMTPLLITAFGVPASIALGTDRASRLLLMATLALAGFNFLA